MRPQPTLAADRVVWHDVECGVYAADLPLWEELAAGRERVLELGCGTGRVALRLARAGARVTGLDRDPSLLAELRGRAAAAGLALDAVEADARDFDLGRRFALVLAPMQLAHLLAAADRAAMLRAAAAHLAADGMVAIALLAEDPSLGAGHLPPTPDVRERDGWVYSSLPIEVRHAGGAIEVRRLRQTVAPDGALSEALDVISLEALSPATLEAEARAAGLTPAGRREVPATADHVGSVVVILGAP